jgi:hypothetical protein
MGVGKDEGEALQKEGGRYNGKANGKRTHNSFVDSFS